MTSRALRPLAIIATAATARSALAAWSPPARFEPARDAQADLNEALVLAAREGRRVILDVGGEWCVWCRIMDRFIDENAELRALKESGFVWLRINFSKDNKNEAFLARYPKIAGYPHLFVLDARGNLLHSQPTDELEEGKSYSTERLLAFMRKWAGRRAA